MADDVIGIPIDAKPWNAIQAALPPGWRLTLVGVQRQEGRVEVGALWITREGSEMDGGHYSVALSEPIFMTEDEASQRPAWVDACIAERKILTVPNQPPYPEGHWSEEHRGDHLLITLSVRIPCDQAPSATLAELEQSVIRHSGLK